MFRDDARQTTQAPATPWDDPAVFGELYDRTFSQVYGFAFSATRNHADAEDITSETYERALRRLARFNGDPSLAIAWIIGIARNVIREHWRARERLHDRLPDPSVMDGMTELQTAPVADNGLLEALTHLTSAQREVVQMRLAGFKVREIAVALGKAEGTVKALQFAAVRKLRKAVSE